jgi:hypothetical protein
VLTLTSLGMVKRSRPHGRDVSPVVALEQRATRQPTQAEFPAARAKPRDERIARLVTRSAAGRADHVSESTNAIRLDSLDPVTVRRSSGPGDRFARMSSGLNLAEYRPSGRLASYVRAFQALSTDASARVSVLDFAGADVSIPLRFGDPVVIEGSGLEEVPSAAVVGPRARSTWLRFHGRIDQVNVSFFPGVAGAFVGVPLPEIVGRVALPDEVWPRDFREAVAEMEPLPVEERISRLSDLLLARLEPAREPGPQVREAVRLIYAMRGRVRGAVAG